jgi:stringent starvation protein B
MTSKHPYLIRAIHEWIVDNQLTSYIMVDATLPRVIVPSQFVEDGKIVLNISPHAVVRLSITNQVLEFDASFSGVPTHISVPIQAVKAIYAYENGEGMVFEDEEEVSDELLMDSPPSPSDSSPKGKPSLKIVK